MKLSYGASYNESKLIAQPSSQKRAFQHILSWLAAAGIPRPKFFRIWECSPGVQQIDFGSYSSFFFLSK